MPRKREPAPPSRTIRVDDEVYKFLQEHAEALTDSPNDVLRKKLGLPAKPCRKNRSDGYEKEMAREDRALQAPEACKNL